MKKYTAYALIAASLLAFSFIAGRKSAPLKVSYRDKIVEKIVEVENKNVKTVVVETKKPDGTVQKETTTIDLSVTKREDSRKQDTTKVVKNSKPQWRIGAGAGLQNFRGEIVYSGTVERRILGPVFVGVQAHPQLRYGGLTVSVEF